MADPKDVPLGKGLAEAARSFIMRRSADVDRAVSESVQGEAAKARKENEQGVGTRNK
jgi:hypothetical protein